MKLSKNAVKEIKSLGGYNGWWNIQHEAYLYQCVATMIEKGIDENIAIEMIKNIIEIVKDEFDV